VQALETGPATPPPVPVASILTVKARALYEALREVGRTVSDARGYHAKVSVVFFFCPGEIVARACGMARSTMYLKLAELRDAGLVEARAHYITYRGRTRADGMCWGVRLDPEHPGAVKVPYDYLKRSWRCLSADIEAGRTAYAQIIGQSKGFPGDEVDTKSILSWALPLQQPSNHVKSLTVRADLEQVLDVPYVDKQDRNTAVDGAARALSMGLADAGGLMFYRWLLWQLLRLEDRGQGGHWHAVYEMARRARADTQEGFARKPGALFTSRLKGASWWELVHSLPAYRVGLAPTSSLLS